MSKFYKFSEKLQYKEVMGLKKRFAILVVILTIFITTAVFFLFSYLNPSSNISKLKFQQRTLKDKSQEIVQNLSTLDEKTTEILKQNRELINSVDLVYLGEQSIETDLNSGEYASISTRIIEQQLDKIDDRLNKLEENLLELSSAYYLEEAGMLKYNGLINSIPAILPAKAQFCVNFSSDSLQPHRGIDLILKMNTRISATADGIVTFSGVEGSFGLTIVIKHGFGYHTIYSCLSKSEVIIGQKVKRGELIGFSGKSCVNCSGEKLHYEIRHNGVALNPLNFTFSDLRLFGSI